MCRAAVYHLSVTRSAFTNMEKIPSSPNESKYSVVEIEEDWRIDCEWSLIVAIVITDSRAYQPYVEVH